jgi:hypothetical protein
MQDSIIVSIPHTGTNFIGQQLDISHRVHSHAPWDVLLREIGHKKIITPIRHPFNVWDSWCKRYASEPGFAYTTWGFAWKSMDILDHSFFVDFIDLEAKTDPRIDDWSDVIGSADREPWPIPPVLDIKRLWEMSFVNRHYVWTMEMEQTWTRRVHEFRREK